MLIEHLFYSAALAVVMGMIYFRLTGRDPSWIIIVSAFAPDLDVISKTQLSLFLQGPLTVINDSLHHGMFHNVGFLVVYAVIFGILSLPLGLKLIDAVGFAAVGYGAHLAEDALVFNPAYAFLWPFSFDRMGLGIIEYTPHFLGIADWEVLIVGIFLLLGTIFLRTVLEGGDWIQNFLQFGRGIFQLPDYE